MKDYFSQEVNIGDYVIFNSSIDGRGWEPMIGTCLKITAKKILIDLSRYSSKPHFIEKFVKIPEEMGKELKIQSIRAADRFYDDHLTKNPDGTYSKALYNQWDPELKQEKKEVDWNEETNGFSE